MPRMKLTKPESLRVSKMFWELLRMQEERMRWLYWEIHLDALQAIATRYDIGQLMELGETLSQRIKCHEDFTENNNFLLI